MASPVSLLRIDEMPTTVLLPASFVALAAEGFFFAVADRLDAAAIDTRCRQRIFDRAGALVAQSQVVVCRATLVAVSFNREVHIRMLIEELCIGLNRGLLIAPNLRLVVIEVDVFDVLREQVFVRDGWRRRRRRRWWLCNCQPRRRFLRATRTFGSQMIGGGVRRRNTLRTVWLHGAYAIDRHIGGIAGLPC